jgi:hypothetical protein
MVFQLIRFTPPAVACTDRELLPRVFTLTPEYSGAVIFCGTFCPPGLYIRKAFLLGSMVLCVVPTFLRANGAAIERTAVAAKVQNHIDFSYLCKSFKFNEGFEYRK